MEQLKLTFELKHPKLPKEFDRLMVSFFKASIQGYSQDLFEKLYDKTKSVMKTYTFCSYLPNAKFQEGEILLGENSFSLFFSDADLREMIHFFNAFRLMRNIEYPVSGNSMKLVSVGMQKRTEITDNELVVKMQGSLLARKHDVETNTDTYFTYEQDGFAEAVKENIRCFLEKMGSGMSADDFSITPVKGKKVVVPVFGRNTDANIGIYKLTGSPELLNVLYLSGIGARRSEGHGKFEILW